MRTLFLRVLSLFLLLSLSVFSLVRAQTTSLPVQYDYALQGLSEYLGRPVALSELQSYSFTIASYTDSALGCPYVVGSPLTIPSVQGYTFTLILNNTPYDVRVEENGAIAFLCAPAAGQTTPVPASTVNPNVTVLPVSGNRVPGATPTPCPADYTSFLAPRLQVGAQAQVPPGNTPNRIRDLPALGGLQVGLIDAGSTVDVVGGPSCDATARIIWWQVAFNGIIGWTAEGQLPNDYFIDPLNNAAIAPTPAPNVSELPEERSTISAFNVAGITTLLQLPVTNVSDIAFSPDQAYVVLAGADGVIVYDLPTLTINEALSAPDESVTAAVVTADGAGIAYAQINGGIIAADALTGALTTLADIPGTTINDLDNSSDNPDEIVAAYGDVNGILPEAGVRFYTLENAETTEQTVGDFAVQQVAYSVDGAFVAFEDSRLRVVERRTGEERLILDASSPYGLVEWQPRTIDEGGIVDNAPYLLYSLGSAAYRLNLDTQATQAYELPSEVMFPAAASFSPDGTLLALISDSGLNIAVNSFPRLDIFDVATGDILFDLELPVVRAIAFSPDGTLLAVATEDTVILLSAG